MKTKVIAIVGPTASGKTKMAIDLAKEIDGEIISADSRYVYKGFDIASAKPTMEERDGVPHHLIDIVEPEVDYSVADFYDDAKAAIDDIVSRGKTPIVAGGTGLYMDNTIYNTSFVAPKRDENITRELMEICEKEGAAALFEILKKCFA